jgi:hypothetical protein
MNFSGTSRTINRARAARTRNLAAIASVVWLVLRSASMDASIYAVTNTNDSGPGSLRQAIRDANGSPGSIVTFLIGAGVKTIRPLSELPMLQTGTIDGTTQPGYAGTPLIEIDGSLLPAFSRNLAVGGASGQPGIVKALISNRGFWGVAVASGGILLSSFVGTDPTGTMSRPNRFGVKGLPTGFDTVVIGGTGPGEGNLISGNFAYGIDMQAPGSILGNRIGTDMTGLAALPNGDDGILVDYTSNVLIGGPTLGSGNLISANAQYGVGVEYANDVVIQGNTIGPDAAGRASFANQRSGVDIYQSSRAIIGGPGGAANIIANHWQVGVGVRSGSLRNRVSQNSIYGNAFGIDLDFMGGIGPRVTPNDDCDDDVGPNLLLNYPVLTAVTSIGGQTTISGSLNSEPNAIYVLEFFWNPSCNALGYGEGKTYLGSTSVTTNSSCTGTFVTTFPVSVPNGAVITATSTDAFDDTSEFSACLPVLAPASFYTITPCRVVDTRDPVGPNGGPALQAGIQRNFSIASHCGVPSTAQSIAANIAVTQPQMGGHLRVFPSQTAVVSTSAINFGAGQTRANNSILNLGSGSLEVLNNSGGTVHFILDVNGYFQ